MKFDRVWSMPSKNTFSIKPIKELIEEEKTEGKWIDPFANGSKVPSESPKVEPKKEEVKVENKGEVSHETPVETYKAPMLPQTGSEAGVALSVLGLTVLSLTVAFKKKEI